MFEADGAHVDTAADGAKAYELAMAAPYDLVVMDLKLPDANGCEVIEALRGAGYRQPIICFTASAAEGQRALAITAGCDDYFTKPMPLSALKEIVRSRLQERRARTVT